MHVTNMISVCLASYNGGLYIGEQIESILQQLQVNDELVISDDGSSDNTLAVIARFQDARIRLVNGPRQGLIKNFEYALAQAKGDVIFLSDQDDIWHERKVTECLTILSNDQVSMVVTDCQVIDASRKVIAPSFFKMRHSGGGLFKNLIKNSYLGCCLAFKRRILLSAMPFPDSIPMHDWWLGLIANMYGKVIFLDMPLLSYRRHGANVSCTADVSSFSLREKFYHRSVLFFYVCLRVIK